METLLLLTLAIVTSGLGACVAGPAQTIPPVSAATLTQPKKTMPAFKSEQELLVGYFRQLAEKQKRQTRRAANQLGASADMSPRRTPSWSTVYRKDRDGALKFDWYGNARPLFLRGRVFALLGYEIVEGTLDDGRMKELRRVNYAPGRHYVTRGE